jgi:UPF0042 nucleotide-binding protein
VIRFLEAQPRWRKMEADLRRFIADWLPAYVRDNRSYLTVASAAPAASTARCTSPKGWPRIFAASARVLVRHRSLIE